MPDEQMVTNEAAGGLTGAASPVSMVAPAVAGAQSEVHPAEVERAQRADGHHGLFSNVLATLSGGRQELAGYDEEGKPQYADKKPGQMWASMLSGMIAGLASGMQGHSAGEAAALGAAGGVAQAEKTKEKRETTAEKRFVMSQEQKKTAAQVGMWTQQTIEAAQRAHEAKAMEPMHLRAAELGLQEHSSIIKKNEQDLAKGYQEMNQVLGEAGIEPERVIGGLGDLTKEDAQKIARGDVVGIWNGETVHEGDAPIGALFSTQNLSKPLPQREKPYTFDWRVPQADGSYKTETRTLPPGSTVKDYVAAKMMSLGQVHRIQQEAQTKLKQESEKAEIGLRRAQTVEAVAGTQLKLSQAEMNRMMDGPEGDKLVDAAYDMRLDPAKIFSMRTNRREMFSRKMAEKHPDFDWGAFQIGMKTKAAFTSGDIGKNLGNFSTAIEHLNQLSQAAKQFNNGDVMAFNRAAIAFGYQTGKTPAATYNIIQNALADELSRAYTGVGATVESSKQLKEGFVKEQSPKQADAAIRAALVTLQSRANSLRQIFVNGMPQYLPEEKRQPEQHGVQLLSPPARQVMDMWGLGKAGPQTAPAGPPKGYEKAHAAKMPNGSLVYSLDGKAWVDASGNPLK
mgnify:CR=1 FL=1